MQQANALSEYQFKLLLDKERRRRGTLHSQFADFQKRYKYDPVGFIQDCIQYQRGEHPTAYQYEIVSALINQKRVSVRAPHGSGKTTLAAWITLWAVLTSDDCKVLTTASAWRQLTHFLWPEIHKWSARLDWNKIGRQPFRRKEMSVLAISRQPNAHAFALASNNANLIEGAHAERIVYIYDEAKAIENATYDATEGAFAGAGSDTSQEAYALAISTPGYPAGRFYDIHSRKPGYEDWWVRHVTLEEGIAAGRISKEWVDQRKVQWGEDSAVFKNRVLGEFATDAEANVIPLAWVELANERWRDWAEVGFPGTLTSVGVDVGGGLPGSDLSVFARCYDRCKVRDVTIQPGGNPTTATMETVAIVVRMLNSAQTGEAIVDVNGIGAGVMHRMAEMHYPVRGYNAARATTLTDATGEIGFAGWYDAGWWALREMLDPRSNIPVALPPDDDLTGDLCSPHHTLISTGGGRRKVEGKATVKARLGRSPDRADAVIHGLVGPVLCDLWEREHGESFEVSYEPVRVGAW